MRQSSLAGESTTLLCRGLTKLTIESCPRCGEQFKVSNCNWLYL